MSDDWVDARVVPYLHDAVRLRTRLADSGIAAQLPDEAAVTAAGSLGAAAGMRIVVRAADLERARNIIDEAWDVPPDPAVHPEGPLATYVEWSRHQYDPGHYLGGTIEPHLRGADRLGPRARFAAGVLLLAQSAIGMVVVLGWWQDLSWELALSVAVQTVMAAAGWRLLARR